MIRITQAAALVSGVLQKNVCDTAATERPLRCNLFFLNALHMHVTLVFRYIISYHHMVTMVDLADMHTRIYL